MKESVPEKYLKFERMTCSDVYSGKSREWLETNGIGGFASGTIAGMHTRKYHGLLVAATKPPLGRMLLLSKLEEIFTVNLKSYMLSCNQYPDAIFPHGYQHLVEFKSIPFPTYTYQIKTLKLVKTIFMPQGENTVVIIYSLEGDAPEVKLEINPLMAFRSYHDLTMENQYLNTGIEQNEGWFKCEPYRGVTPLYFFHGDCEVIPDHHWYKNFIYEEELHRSLPYQEDLFSLTRLKYNLNPGDKIAIVASTDGFEEQIPDWNDLFEIEKERRNKLLFDKLRTTPSSILKYDELKTSEQILNFAADKFIVSRGQGKSTIIAGYPWFTDWGRDTMIALSGLTLVTGRFEEARSILLAFADYCSEGMIPNRFPEYGEIPEYNTVDASLWYINALWQYLKYTDDKTILKTPVLKSVQDIIHYYHHGTRFGISADSDGLITAGEAGWQLTWMDSKIQNWVVTPRQGKPVEINALWYNALKIMFSIMADLKDSEKTEYYEVLAEKCAKSFREKFWSDKLGYLYDYIDGEHLDDSLRPNQVFALSLDFRMLPNDQEKSIMEAMEKHLLTPYGLRSLAPDDPCYCPRYDNDPNNWDSTYHQGTVWSWLMGPYVTAYLNTFGRNKKNLNYVRTLLLHLESHLRSAGLGSISEVFDGESPHRPSGCFAQAWSVAELLRIYKEEF